MKSKMPHAYKTALQGQNTRALTHYAMSGYRIPNVHQFIQTFYNRKIKSKRPFLEPIYPNHDYLLVPDAEKIIRLTQLSLISPEQALDPVKACVGILPIFEYDSLFPGRIDPDSMAQLIFSRWKTLAPIVGIPAYRDKLAKYVGYSVCRGLQNLIDFIDDNGDWTLEAFEIEYDDWLRLEDYVTMFAIMQS
jgi:hypothetical protein